MNRRLCIIICVLSSLSIVLLPVLVRSLMHDYLVWERQTYGNNEATRFSCVALTMLLLLIAGITGILAINKEPPDATR